MPVTCTNYKLKCGGCPLLNQPYSDQLKHKQQLEQHLLGRFAPVSPVLGQAEPWHYRNKAIATFATGPRGRLTCGIYAAGTHRVLPYTDCLLQDTVINQTIAAVLEAARACRWPAFEEDRGTGLLRHVLVRRGKTSGQVLVVLVTAQENLPGSRNFVKVLREKAPWVTSVVQNCNPRRTSAVLGSDVRTLYGPGKITDTLCGLQFAISPRSFYQVNPEQTEVLYAKAIEFAALTGKETVIDAYCGIGTIGLCAAGRAKQVIGVERNPDAVRNACANAAANKINNARFICADATDWMRAAAQPNSGLPHPDVVFLDPPREGSTPACIDAVAAMKPKRVVYVSCNPETLARDLTHLTRRGWKALKIQPVDMFPHTEHVDTNLAQEKELCIQEMARRICERRKQLRLTQEELAEMSDMTTQAVSYAESGKRAMRPDSLRKLAAALCVSADYLLTGDIVDKDLLILADKLRQLTPSQIHTIESIIDECIQLYSEQ